MYKPALVDVIDFSEAYTKELSMPFIQYNIETKWLPETDTIFHPQPAEFIELIMSVVKEKKIEKRVIIQSFDIRTLQYLHKKYPFIKTSYLFEPPSDKSLTEQLNELGFTPTIYSPDYTTVTAILVDQCKKIGMKLIPWTVNDLAKMNELKQMGVDGVISDYPNLFEQLR